jgi:hypothetical protein
MVNKHHVDNDAKFYILLSHVFVEGDTRMAIKVFDISYFVINCSDNRVMDPVLEQKKDLH